MRVMASALFPETPTTGLYVDITLPNESLVKSLISLSLSYNLSANRLPIYKVDVTIKHSQEAFTIVLMNSAIHKNTHCMLLCKDVHFVKSDIDVLVIITMKHKLIITDHSNSLKYMY
jgi:hypothetical protein